MIRSFKILCFFSYFDISVFFETEARNVNQILIFPFYFPNWRFQTLTNFNVSKKFQLSITSGCKDLHIRVWVNSFPLSMQHEVSERSSLYPWMYLKKKSRLCTDKWKYIYFYPSLILKCNVYADSGDIFYHVVSYDIKRISEFI